MKKHSALMVQLLGGSGDVSGFDVGGGGGGGGDGGRPARKIATCHKAATSQFVHQTDGMEFSVRVVDD